jgi:hypothetical protein
MITEQIMLLFGLVCHYIISAADTESSKGCRLAPLKDGFLHNLELATIIGSITLGCNNSLC